MEGEEGNGYKRFNDSLDSGEETEEDLYVSDEESEDARPDRLIERHDKIQPFSLECEGKSESRNELNDKIQPFSLECEGKSESRNEGNDKIQPFSFVCDGRSERPNEGNDKIQPFSLECEGKSESRNELNDKIQPFSLECEGKSKSRNELNDKIQPFSLECEGRSERPNEGNDKIQPFSLECEGRSERPNEGNDKIQPFSFVGDGGSESRNEGNDKVQPFSRKFEGEEGGRVKKRGLEEIEIAVPGKSTAVLSEDDKDEDKEGNGNKRCEDDKDEDKEGNGNKRFKGDEGDDIVVEKESVGNEVCSVGGSESYLSETRFDQFSLSPLSLKGIKDMGYEKMSVVQEATFPVILKGKDVLAKSRTGTGKTVAFLLPAIEIVSESPPVTPDQILVLVVCPTRELANQAAAQATALLKYHSTIGVQVVIGGTTLSTEQKRIQANPCQILVATPGRLIDHVKNTEGFATRLMGVKVLVLDEADRLLDMGFRKDIERIIDAVPKERQTLLFSATVSHEVRQICNVALKSDHEFISAVENGSEETHSQVQQMHLIAPLHKHFSLLYTLLRDHISDDANYKVIVFCTTARMTQLVAQLLGELKLNVREIHSRKNQGYRTRVSDEFRNSKGLILVTSDVSARGVDYPDVTLVLQIGLPSDKQQYIHRLGRTGRKGKVGKGILMLAPFEEFFLSKLKNLPITKAPEPLINPYTKTKVDWALSQVEEKYKEAAYQAWLGYYSSNKVGSDKCKLVQLALEFSRSMGLDEPPVIDKLIARKMGLRNIPGLLTY